MRASRGLLLWWAYRRATVHKGERFRQVSFARQPLPIDVAPPHCLGSEAPVDENPPRLAIVPQDGSSRLFKPGEHFFSADTLPDGATFDPKVHGHWSVQRGGRPLVTLFVKT